MNEIDQTNFSQVYHLSTEGYHFRYRADRHDASLIRATLFDKDENPVDDVIVSSSYGLPAKGHFTLINHFEARLTLGQIK